MPNAATGGQFLLGGETPVNRMCFGAMRLSGPAILVAELDGLGDRPRRSVCPVDCRLNDKSSEESSQCNS